MIKQITNNYINRFGWKDTLYNIVFTPQTTISVVIPAFNEPDLNVTLNSLWKCDETTNPICVIVVINFSITANEESKLLNERLAAETTLWFDKNDREGIYGYVIKAFNLPTKHAGVGLARKIGMDNAFVAFSNIDVNGWIICLDADCIVTKNYFLQHEKVWKNNERGGVCYFEHPLINEEIIKYELYLRYYVQALKWTEYPYVSHTVGSTIAVRASVYAQLGGMNKRQAGEDFYFIQKLLPNGRIEQIIDATVFPSSRLSNRVPFGTGQEIANMKEIYLVNNFNCFVELKQLVCSINKLSKDNYKHFTTTMPSSCRVFFSERKFEQVIDEIALNTKSDTAFVKRVYAWFNNLKVLQLIHYLELKHHKIELQQACNLLLKEKGKVINNKSYHQLLTTFRLMDKK